VVGGELMLTTLELRQVVVGDVRTPALIGGPSDTETAEAVVFVHGNPGAGSDWRDLMTQVSEFVTVVAPDMPGFGSAEMRADQDYTVAGYARHLEGIVENLGIQRVHLVAHDFGGPWALTYAAANLDRIASVTLINTGVLVDYRWHRLARVWRIPGIGEVFQRMATPRLATALLAHDNPGLDALWVTRIAAHLRPWGTKRAVLRLYRSTRLASMPPLAAALRKRNLPCLVVWGTEDVYLPTALAERQREAFPSAQIHTVPGAGHWVWLEQPDGVADLVLPHLRDQVKSRAPGRARPGHLYLLRPAAAACRPHPPKDTSP
jgi:pimeloyl-ACP methyl ester carboxylesterase